MTGFAVPPSGLHRGEVAMAVEARRHAGDARVYLIDLSWIIPLAPNRGSATIGSLDGGHLTLYGQAEFGVGIAVKIQEILSKEGQP